MPLLAQESGETRQMCLIACSSISMARSREIFPTYSSARGIAVSFLAGEVNLGLCFGRLDKRITLAPPDHVAFLPSAMILS